MKFRLLLALGLFLLGNVDVFAAVDKPSVASVVITASPVSAPGSPIATYNSFLERNRKMTNRATLFALLSFGTIWAVGLSFVSSPVLLILAFSFYGKAVKARRALLSELAFEEDKSLRLHYIAELKIQRKKLIWFWLGAGLTLACFGFLAGVLLAIG